MREGTVRSSQEVHGERIDEYLYALLPGDPRFGNRFRPPRLVFVAPGVRVERGWRLNNEMGAGYVGILSVELHFPENGSLKGKRKFVKSAKEQLRRRFGASVAEVDHHELWQRAGLAVSCVSRGYSELEELLAAAERYLGAQEYELIRSERRIMSVEELPGDPYVAGLALEGAGWEGDLDEMRDSD